MHWIHTVRSPSSFTANRLVAYSHARFSQPRIAVHVLEYENYKGYDHSAALIRQSKVNLNSHISCCPANADVFGHKEHTSNFQALLPFIQNRNLQLCQEFAFWASSPPHQKGGIFELRTYQLQAGTLLEWESAWYALLICYPLQDCGPNIMHIGGRALRPVGSSQLRSAHGSRRSDVSLVPVLYFHLIHLYCDGPLISEQTIT